MNVTIICFPLLEKFIRKKNEEEIYVNFFEASKKLLS